jgi:hypothetical protein
MVEDLEKRNEGRSTRPSERPPAVKKRAPLSLISYRLGTDAEGPEADADPAVEKHAPLGLISYRLGTDAEGAEADADPAAEKRAPFELITYSTEFSDTEA